MIKIINIIQNTFDHKILYSFQLSVKQINYSTTYVIRNIVIECFTSYLGLGAIFCFNNEAFETLHLYNKQLYVYNNIKTNEGYKIK